MRFKSFVKYLQILEVPMDCSDIRVYMAFLDEGSLDPEIEAEVKLHILLCNECRAEFESVRKMLSAVRTGYSSQKTETAFGSDLTLHVWHGIKRRKRERRLIGISLSSAAVVLIAVSIYFTGLFRGQTEKFDMAENSDAYYNYLAAHYMPASDAISLTGEVPLAGDYEMDEGFTVDTDFLMQSGYVNMSVDKMFQHLDSSQIEELFQLASY